MKKEHFWFLIFILAAAVVTGSTLGIFTNFKYISKQSQLIHQDNQVNSGFENTNLEQGASNSAQQIAAQKAVDTTIMVVSSQEQKEIEAMLNTVEISNCSDFNARVKIFQEKNALPITGIMDYQTLNTLINLATIQKSIQRLNN